MLPIAAFAQSAPLDEGPARVAHSSPWRVLLENGASRDASSGRVGVQYDFATQWSLGSERALYPSLDLTAGYWRVNRSDRTEVSVVSEAGLTPTLRLGGPSRTGFFAEIGVGAIAISPRFQSTRARFSTNYQFGDHFGVGWRSRGAHRWEVALRYEHFSNAGIKKPNPGEGFAQLRLSAGF